MCLKELLEEHPWPGFKLQYLDILDAHLLEVLSLVSLLSELWKGHVKKLQQNYGREAGGGLVHSLI